MIFRPSESDPPMMHNQQRSTATSHSWQRGTIVSAFFTGGVELKKMVTKINLKEVGWMYHAPAVKVQHEEVLAPPASQIPMLGIQEELPRQEPKEMIFKDTDTPYIMLAKMNGRSDLLRFREWDPNAPQKIKPKGSGSHHGGRCDWFYLEDNALEDAEKRGQEDPEQQHVFVQPDYMVHQAFNPNDLPPRELYSHYPGKPSRRTPYATYDSQQIGHEAKGAADLDDARRPFGYGVRQAKFRHSDEKKRGGHKDVSQLPPAGVASLRKDLALSGFKDEPFNMSKIMSHSYAPDKCEGGAVPRSTQEQKKSTPNRPNGSANHGQRKATVPRRG